MVVLNWHIFWNFRPKFEEDVHPFWGLHTFQHGLKLNHQPDGDFKSRHSNSGFQNRFCAPSTLAPADSAFFFFQGEVPRMMGGHGWMFCPPYNKVGSLLGGSSQVDPVVRITPPFLSHLGGDFLEGARPTTWSLGDENTITMLLVHSGYKSWEPILQVRTSCKWGYPSRELTYPPKMAFWRWFSFSKVGYVSSLEGITSLIAVITPVTHLQRAVYRGPITSFITIVSGPIL